jgi:hypothetical protein
MVKSNVLLDPKELSTLLSLTKNGGKVYMMTYETMGWEYQTVIYNYFFTRP